MQASEKNKPVQVTLNTYLHCLYRANRHEMALSFFKSMESKDIYTYSINNLYLLKKGKYLFLSFVFKDTISNFNHIFEL